MERDEFRHLVESIFRAEEQELSCSRYFELLPRFVDLSLAGRDPEAILPEVGHHFRQCPECREVYEAVLEAAADEGSPSE